MGHGAKISMNTSNCFLYYFEDLSIGASASLQKTIVESDVYNFAGVSMDVNPIHLNEEFARKTKFRGRIAHGLISVGLLSGVFGTRMPGPGSILVTQSLRYRRPVYFGDTVTATVTVKKLVSRTKLITFDTTCCVNDAIVISGEATVMAPSRMTTSSN